MSTWTGPFCQFYNEFIWCFHQFVSWIFSTNFSQLKQLKKNKKYWFKTGLFLSWKRKYSLPCRSGIRNWWNYLMNSLLIVCINLFKLITEIKNQPGQIPNSKLFTLWFPMGFLWLYHSQQELLNQFFQAVPFGNLGLQKIRLAFLQVNNNLFVTCFHKLRIHELAHCPP